VVEVMGVDPLRIARATRLDEEMTAALVQREGQLGELLNAVKQFEQTGQTVTAIDATKLSRAHLHALGTAIDTIDSILGVPALDSDHSG
jgi:c-di-GMP-related signal transduction protein